MHRSGVHRLEGRARHRLELVEVGVVPLAVGGAGQEPVRAVVGDEHAVGLEALQDDPGRAVVAAQVEGRLQPEPGAHRRDVRIGGGAGLVGGRADVAALGGGHGEPQRVVDVAGQHLVAADQAGQDRQPGGVGRGPAGRPERVRVQVEHRAGLRGPAAAAAGRPVQLVQVAVAGGDQHVRVAAGLDPGARRDRVRARVALVAVGGEPDRHLRLAGRHHAVRDAVGRVRAEVRVQEPAAADAGDPGRRARADRGVRDVAPPRVVGREQRAAGDAGRSARVARHRQRQPAGPDRHRRVHRVRAGPSPASPSSGRPWPSADRAVGAGGEPGSTQPPPRRSAIRGAGPAAGAAGQRDRGSAPAGRRLLGSATRMPTSIPAAVAPRRPVRPDRSAP